MAKLPNADRAVVRMEKLVDYSLNIEHRYGKHKALLFRDVLGITTEHAAILRDALLTAARTSEAEKLELDEYGQRYRIDFPFSTAKSSTIIRSGWIVRVDEDFPRLTTCYILKE